MEIIKKLFNLLLGILGALSQGLQNAIRKQEATLDPDNSKNNQNSPWLMHIQRHPFAFLLFLFLILSFINNIQSVQRDEIPFSEFISAVKSGKVENALVTERFITGTLKAEKGETRTFATIPLWQSDLAQLLQENKVNYLVRSGENWVANLLFNWIIPIGIFALIWTWVMRRSTHGAQSFLNIGKKARIQQDTSPKITFKDVAGADSAKQELGETIDFLKNPDKIHKLGGRMPKGVLLVGSPGTGKTLLARAVSGEAQVPFFNISGSEFIELFVGVGAARVRELFEQARAKAPCIVFIDELDAIGRSRGGPVIMGGHDERDQTLNQLLTEMDGFDASVGVVVMAATNRPEVLDKALMRAGRFDRQIIVDKPDLLDRIEILKLHTKGMPIASDTNMETIAKRTPGLVGADLANIANEAAIIATRTGQSQIRMQDFEAAIDRILAGPEKKNRALSPDEKRRVAYHEAGHAMIAENVPHGQPVHKISIIPRGVSALGFTLQLPVEEKYLSTEEDLKDQLAILLGGRLAEEIVLGSISTGAQNDLERASDIARAMICQLGMSKKLGPLTYGKRQQLQFLETEANEWRNYSEETAKLIDAEIQELIREAETRSREILSKHRDILDRLAKLLQEKEVVNREEILPFIKVK